MKYMKHPALLDWLKDVDRALLQQYGVTYSYLRLIGYGHKQPSARVASQVEKMTNGAVRRQELRPQDWQLIWPELAEEQHLA